MKLYNSLTRKVQDFSPLEPGRVKMYTCGPTVYDYASIGNFRTYVTADLLVRALQFNGLKVDYIMNLTDVGHLTGDNLGDADTGEDRLEKSSQKEGKSAWDIADFYSQAFLVDFEKLNLVKPEKFTKATEHIAEQIELVRRIEAKGFTYKTSDGIYFNTKKFEEETGKKYGVLSNLNQIKEGARVEVNPEKKNPRDFALWKFSPKQQKRQMEWESPWGVGFPGWHIECSAMSMKYLGETLDIHVGGEDLRETHHPNEIAQSEAATDKTFARYWVHGAFLRVDGKRMGKSLGNFYTISDIQEKGFSPLALRYFYMTAHYRDPLNFTWEALTAAQRALDNLAGQVRQYKSVKQGIRNRLSEEKLEKVDSYRTRFTVAISDDLNLPQALAVVWEAVKSNIPSEDKLDLLYSFDEVLGFNFREITPVNVKVTAGGLRLTSSVPLPTVVTNLLDEREKVRKNNEFEKADQIRDELREKHNLIVKDTPQGVEVTAAQNVKKN